MTSEAPGTSFLDGLPVLSEFGNVVRADAYTPVPADWQVGLADVVDSTRAVEAGRYKAVNMAGAAVISAVSNALGGAAFPFVFGGDGSAFAVGPDEAPVAAAALAATATLVGEEFGLDLRIAMVPVSAVRDAGHDVRVARFAASPDVAYAMFSGGGLSWAEREMKGGRFRLPAAPAGTRPDLTGLSCRFEEAPSARGVVLSLIVRPADGGDAAAYAALIQAILRQVEASPDQARPVSAGSPRPIWPAPGLELEARANRKPGGSLLWRRLVLLARSAVSTMVLRWRVRVGQFDPDAYLGQLVANTDYRKYDDGLRLTIDCSTAVADALQAQLVAAEAQGIVRFGSHRQAASIMTCFTPSSLRSDHVHFVDGASGGYAAAAAGLKSTGELAPEVPATHLRHTIPSPSA